MEFLKNLPKSFLIVLGLVLIIIAGAVIYGYRNYITTSNYISSTSSKLSADLNCDGNVNLTDAAILMSFWNKDPSGAASCQSPDINQDGKVNLTDSAIMMSQWGTESSQSQSQPQPQPKPKPSTTSNCTDSDNGKNYYVKGTTCKGSDCKTDTCSGNKIIEYYCRGDRISLRASICVYGCQNGACLKHGGNSVVQSQPQPQPQTQPTNQVGLWHFNEGSGTSAADSSGYNNNATIHGSTWTSGVKGSALDFDGSDDYVKTSSSSTLNLTDKITLEAWVYAKSGQGYRMIISREYGDSYYDEFALGLNPNGYAFFIIRDDTGQYDAEDSTVLSTGIWHYLVGTYNGSVAKIYVDGVDKGSNSSPSGNINAGSHPIVIGAGCNNNNVSYIEQWNGRIDEVRIYNKALTSAEIASHYKGEKPQSAPAPQPQPTPQPQPQPTLSSAQLRVHPDNPRYFTNGSGKAIYLTGSHTWANLQDFAKGNPPVSFDYNKYLNSLENYNHNFIRLWTWEADKYNKNNTYPSIYKRPGPGTAIDGLPKFNLDQLNQAYFNRLRDRVAKAGNRGIYVSVMFFQGWSVGSGPDPSTKWSWHPYHKDNNINGLNGDTNNNGIGSEIHTLNNSTVLAYQKAYVKKVVDTLSGLDNVIWEIGNEMLPDSKNFQYHMIDYIRSQDPMNRMVGMTSAWGDNNRDLFNSSADWISPGYQSGYDYRENPPTASGSKVIIVDTDHVFGIGGDTAWVWKTFTRGNNIIFMDRWRDPLQPEWDPARKSMGDTLTYANKMDLVNMTPRGNLTSTKYALANPGKEYLVYQPGSGSFTVNLVAGTYNFEWFDPNDRSKSNGTITVSSGDKSFSAPSHAPNDSVLYLSVSP